MPLHRRLPKRGFTNNFSKRYAIISVGAINEMEATEIDLNLLVEMGLIKKPGAGLKILGDGELTRPVTIKANRFSKSAVAKIEAANGRAEVL